MSLPTCSIEEVNKGFLETRRRFQLQNLVDSLLGVYNPFGFVVVSLLLFFSGIGFLAILSKHSLLGDIQRFYMAMKIGFYNSKSVLTSSEMMLGFFDNRIENELKSKEFQEKLRTASDVEKKELIEELSRKFASEMNSSTENSEKFVMLDDAPMSVIVASGLLSLLAYFTIIIDLSKQTQLYYMAGYFVLLVLLRFTKRVILNPQLLAMYHGATLAFFLIVIFVTGEYFCSNLESLHEYDMLLYGIIFISLVGVFVLAADVKFTLTEQNIVEVRRMFSQFKGQLLLRAIRAKAEGEDFEITDFEIRREFIRIVLPKIERENKLIGREKIIVYANNVADERTKKMQQEKMRKLLQEEKMRKISQETPIVIEKSPVDKPGPTPDFVEDTEIIEEQDVQPTKRGRGRPRINKPPKEKKKVGRPPRQIRYDLLLPEFTEKRRVGRPVGTKGIKKTKKNNPVLKKISTNIKL